jgi:DtxR family Mn-dependent transcriptional regulator
MHYFKGALKGFGSEQAMSAGLPFGESAEMYLKTIYELSAERPLVPISTMAQRLGISAVSATEMVHRMRGHQLVEHLPYKGVRLTGEGRRRALRVVRRHRLWECFLADHLGLPWHEVHDLACRLEHAMEARVTEALAQHLGHPALCPHGNPIPNAEGLLPSAPGVPLASLEPGAGAVLQRIHPESSEVLEFLAARQILPGAALRVESVDLSDQLWAVRVGDRSEWIAQGVVNRLIVLPDTPEGRG